MRALSQRPARALLLDWMVEALRAVDPRVLVQRSLLSRLRAQAGPLAVIAVGKAAVPMTRGAFEAAEAIGLPVASALVIAPHDAEFGDLAGRDRVRCLTAAHPVPDAASLAAGEALLGAVDESIGRVLPLFLVSGGASSLAEAPRAGVTLEAIVQLNRRGLAAGIAIGELNARRRALSRIKGGGLSAALGGRDALALFLSDVPGDDPAVIGSGLMGPATGGDRVQREIVGSVALAIDAICEAAGQAGFASERIAPRLEGEAAMLGRELAERLLASRAPVLVAGGESTVTLPGTPGRGGRNQHLALAAARALRDREGSLLAFGTDGVDGPTDDAGALVDGGTWQRILDAGLDPDAALAGADAGTALEGAGDLVQCGPTGTNVGDVVIGLRLAA